MILVHELSSRNALGPYLNRLGLVGNGVEVGTHRGEFAKLLLEGWAGRLYCVDPWDEQPEDYIQQAKFLPESSGDRVKDHGAALKTLYKYRDRCMFMKTTSEEAAKSFADDSLDFVYLDGNHEPPHVEQDIRLWWPKLKTGGVLSGHDVVCPGPPSEDNWSQYIFPAIYTFSQEVGRDLHLLVEYGCLPWSYVMVK